LSLGLKTYQKAKIFKEDMIMYDMNEYIEGKNIQRRYDYV